MTRLQWLNAAKVYYNQYDQGLTHSPLWRYIYVRALEGGRGNVEIPTGGNCPAFTGLLGLIFGNRPNNQISDANYWMVQAGCEPIYEGPSGATGSSTAREYEALINTLDTATTLEVQTQPPPISPTESSMAPSNEQAEVPQSPPGGQQSLNPGFVPTSFQPQPDIPDVFKPYYPQWVQLPKSVAVSHVLAESGKPAVGQILTVRGLASIFNLGIPGDPNWAYSPDGGVSWRVQVDGGIGAPDPTVPASSISPSNRAGNLPGSTGGGVATVPFVPSVPTAPPGSPTPMGVPMDLAAMGLVGTQPMTYTVRRCGKGRVLAWDGLCYLKAILPAKLRMNRSKRAPVSWRDAQFIMKGNRAAQRISQYNKAIGKEARKLAPPKPRRIAPKGVPKC